MPIVENFKRIEENLKAAGKKFNVKIEKLPEIVAVTKGRIEPEIVPLLEYGHKIFGENRVQETAGKWPELKIIYKNIKLHLIGPLQTNKVKEALRLFDVIETVDRMKLALALAKELENMEKKPELMIQVNIGEEPQKAGVMPGQADKFIKHCRDLNLPVTGLMCIPPEGEPAGLYFGLLKKIAERNNLKKLSMGMSADYEIAAAFGATTVRIGTAIFGART